MKMELIKRVSKRRLLELKTPGNYPKENMLHIERGESLKSRILIHQSVLQYVPALLILSSYFPWN